MSADAAENITLTKAELNALVQETVRRTLGNKDVAASPVKSRSPNLPLLTPLALGACVRFVDDDGISHAAWVQEIADGEEGVVNLHVLFRSGSPGPVNDVRYSQGADSPGTWHYKRAEED